MKNMVRSVVKGISFALLLFLLTPNPSPAQIHCWPFETINGSAVYDTRGSNNGTVHGNVAITGGIIGNALYFDGAWNSYVAFSSTLNVDNEATFEFWINPAFNTLLPSQYPSSPGVRNTMRKGSSNDDTFIFHIAGNVYPEPGINVVFFYAGSGHIELVWVPLRNLIVQGQWSHIVATFKRNDYARLYINGQLYLSGQTADKPLRASGKKLVIGQICDLEGGENYYRSDETWIGKIDEVAIYNRALTAEEVLNHYVTKPSCIAVSPPVADAGPNLTILSENQQNTILYGSATDPNGDSLNYRWLEGANAITSWSLVGLNGEAPLYLSQLGAFSIGQHTLSLESTDGQFTSKDDMILTVGNSAPHAAPTGSGTYPINTQVILGGQVSDFDGDLLAYEWLEGTNILYAGQIQSSTGGNDVTLPNLPMINFSLGVHNLALRVSDGINTVTSAPLRIEIIDNQAPILSPSTGKTILWPPNHQMVTITILANAVDNSGGSVNLSASVYSNEPQDGLGDGDTSPDWTTPVIDQASGTITLQLRAERSGTGSGRIYTIFITGTDQSGNSSSADIKIIVPHNKVK